jgi:hypothetical protein
MAAYYTNYLVDRLRDYQVLDIKDVDLADVLGDTGVPVSLGRNRERKWNETMESARRGKNSAGNNARETIAKASRRPESPATVQD